MNKKTIRELAREAVDRGGFVDISQIPKPPQNKKRRQPLIGDRRKAVKFFFCPRTYKLIKWWCKTTHQFIGTFVQNAVTDAFIRQIGEREDKIKVMEKYYLQYFEDDCTDEGGAVD